LNPALLEAVKARVEALRAADPENHARVPVDLVTASGSGLDPDISVAAARYQTTRVARALGLSAGQAAHLISAQALQPIMAFFVELRVIVLAVNLALDRLK